MTTNSQDLFDPRRPCYQFMPARSLVGRPVMIVHTVREAVSDTVYVYAHLKAKKRKGKEKAQIQYVYFKAGVVVRQQLERQRFFPVWARLTLVQGKVHE